MRSGPLASITLVLLLVCHCEAELSICKEVGGSLPSSVEARQCDQEADAVQTYSECTGPHQFRCCQHINWLMYHNCHCLPDFDRRQRFHLEKLAVGCTANFKAASKQKTSDVKLFVGVLTQGKNFESRQSIRQTWGADPKLHRVLFFSAKPNSQEVLESLSRENAKYGDIIMLPTISESYFNISYQTLEVLRFGGTDRDATHILKIDDDSYVRVEDLLTRITQAPRSKLFLGFIENPGGGPHRNEKSQWYVTEEEWPSERYPPWAHGAGYIISQDIVRQIASGVGMSASEHRLFKLEDIAVASWVEEVGKSQSWKIEYVHDAGFNYNGCSKYDIVSHYIKPKQMRCMYSRQGTCCSKLG